MQDNVAENDGGASLPTMDDGERGPMRGSAIRQPLVFPETDNPNSNPLFSTHIDALKDSFPCLLCPLQAADKPKILEHMLDVHRIVIDEVDHVLAFHEYLDQWRERLTKYSLDDAMVAISTVADKDTGDGLVVYHMLSPILPEDQQLRERLNKETLPALLAYQEMERANKNYSRQCLFCKDQCSTRYALLNHMLDRHGLSIGLPDNIVCLDKYLDLLAAQLERRECLYCEKTFRTNEVLRVHMRKKKHYRLNPNNKAYDQFYLINYLEPGKDWRALQKECDDQLKSPESESTEWDDWIEEEESEACVCVCLFCTHRECTARETFEHMTKSHGFDWGVVRRERDLDFYKSVKLLNYIRRQTHRNRCYVCDQPMKDSAALLLHAAQANHIDPSLSPSLWDRPEHYFPTYENDALLYAIEDDSDDYTESIS